MNYVSDHYKYIGYIINLFDSNYKNDFNATIADTNTKDN